MVVKIAHLLYCWYKIKIYVLLAIYDIMLLNCRSLKICQGSFSFICTACQCFGHSNECIYDEEVDRLGLSIDVNGNYEGGGVCQNCRDNTQGTNCDQCRPGYFRPEGKSLFDKDVCQGRFICVYSLTKLLNCHAQHIYPYYLLPNFSLLWHTLQVWDIFTSQ